MILFCDTYETETLKTIAVWALFTPDNWQRRPSDQDERGRTAEEHFMHQCVSEDTWFKNMLAIDLERAPLPEGDSSMVKFMRRYAEAAQKRLFIMRQQDDAWWQDAQQFFDVPRNRAWIMLRRLTHSAHHRGTINLHAAFVGFTVVFHLWTDGRHRWVGAVWWADDLCFCEY